MNKKELKDIETKRKEGLDKLSQRVELIEKLACEMIEKQKYPDQYKYIYFNITKKEYETYKVLDILEEGKIGRKTVYKVRTSDMVFFLLYIVRLVENDQLKKTVNLLKGKTIEKNE